MLWQGKGQVKDLTNPKFKQRDLIGQQKKQEVKDAWGSTALPKLGTAKNITWNPTDGRNGRR